MNAEQIKAMEDAARFGTGIMKDGVYVKLGDVWVMAEPEPYYWNLPTWAWKRLTGWRDEYGRKAQLFDFPWFDWDPL